MSITFYYDENCMSKSVFVKNTFLRSILAGRKTWKYQSTLIDYNMQMV